MLNDRMKTIAEQQTQKLVLKGKTIKYNNFNKGTDTETKNDVVFTYNSSKATLSLNGISNGYWTKNFNFDATIPSGHKIIILTKVVNPNNITDYGFRLRNENDYIDLTKHFNTIITTTDNWTYLQFYGNPVVDYSGFAYENINIIDLTECELDYIENINEFYATDLGKAIKSGYYPPYTTSNKLVSLTSPFTFKREIEYNNQVQADDFNDTFPQTQNGITISKVNGNVVLNGTSTNEVTFLFYRQNIIVVGHKYFTINLKSNGLGLYGVYDINEPHLALATSNNDYLALTIKPNTTLNNYVFKTICIDLTQLGLDRINSVADFYKTDLGQEIKKGVYLPYSVENSYIIGRNLIDYKTQYDTGDFNLNGNVLENIRVDQRANDNFNFAIYDYTLYGDAFGKTITTNGKHIVTFTPTHSGEYAFYHSGSSINLNIFYYYLENGQTYTISFDVISHDSRVVGGLKIANIQLEKGDKATPYEPYLRELVYTRTKRVDLGTLTWILETNAFFTCHELQNYIKKHTQYTQAPNFIKCGKYENSSALLIEGGSVNKKIGIGGDSYSIIIRDTDYTDATTFKNSLSGVILEYETAEPLELNGINNDRVVDLGRLTWEKDGEHTFYSRTNLNMKVESDGSKLSNIKCERYVNNSFVNVDYLYQEGIALSISNEQPTIFITDNKYTDATDFKNSLNGIMLTYETDRESLCDTFTNTSGKVNRKYFKLKINDISFNYSSGNFRFTISTAKAWNVTSEPSPYIFLDGYETKSANDLLTTSDKCIGQSGQVVIIRDTRYTSVAQFKSAVGELKVMYLHGRTSGTTETERSVLVDHRYNKVVDTNGIEIDTD